MGEANIIKGQAIFPPPHPLECLYWQSCLILSIYLSYVAITISFQQPAIKVLATVSESLGSFYVRAKARTESECWSELNSTAIGKQKVLSEGVPIFTMGSLSIYRK